MTNISLGILLNNMGTSIALFTVLNVTRLLSTYNAHVSDVPYITVSFLLDNDILRIIDFPLC